MKKITKKGYDTYLIISTLIALIIILASLYFFTDAQKHEVLKYLFYEMLRTIGITLLVANFVTFIEKRFSNTPVEQIKEVIVSEFGNYNITSDTGIKKVSLCKSVEDYSDIIENAKSLDFLFHTGTKLYEKYENSLHKAIMNGCKIRVLVGDPSSPLYTNKKNKAIEKILVAYDNRNLKNANVTLHDIKRTISTIGSIQKGVPESLKTNGSIEVRLLSCYATGSLFIVDGEYCYFTPYFPYEVSLNCICFEFKDNGSDYFMLLSNTYENAWNDAKDYQETEGKTSVS